MPSRRVIHVVDDDDGVLESLGLLLSVAGYSVLTYTSGIAFLAKLDPSIPACVLLDFHMQHMDGLEVQRRLVKRGSAFPIILLTGQGDLSIAVRALKNGAFEFLEKPYPNDLLLQAVAEAFAKLEGCNFDRATTVQAKAGVAKLIRRETDVMRGLLAGLPNKLIAHELGISVSTVEIYRAEIMGKFQAKSLSEAVRIALAAGLEPLPRL